MNSLDTSSILPALNQLALQSDQLFFLYNLHTEQLDFINPYFQKIWETDQSETDAESLLQTVHPDDASFLEESYGEFLRGSCSKRIEFRLLLPEGTLKWVSLLAYYFMEDGEKQYIVGFAEEITGRKERENTAARYNARKNSVLAILSHDVKGSLALISVLNAEVAEHLKASGNADMQEYTRLIGQMCSKDMEMIHSLLDAEFLDSANVELIRKRLDLVENIQEVFNEYKHAEKSLDRNFQLVTSTESVYVEVDEVLFTQVFNNLISNAIKFTRDGGSITVMVEENRKQVRVCVKDDGVGIPKHLQPVLFDRFGKARRPGNKGERSTGLGLSIVKQIIELHGGRIWVESEENEGTGIFFEVPKITKLQPVD